MILEPEVRARLESLSLRTRGRVRGMWAGRHASLHRGESVDFADHREYVPGDDFRRIDHTLWARLGVVLVRLYEAEEELPLRVVLDASASMGFGAKLETARRLSAVLGYLALAGGDRVQVVRVPGTAGRALDAGPWMRHPSSWPRLERWLEEVRPEGPGNLLRAVELLSAPSGPRGPLVVVSDLLVEGWQKAIDALGSNGGGVILHVLSPDELEPRLTGDLRLVDSETGRFVSLSASPEAMARYRKALEGFLLEARSRAKRSGLDYVLLPSREGAEERMVAALAAAGTLR